MSAIEEFDGVGKAVVAYHDGGVTLLEVVVVMGKAVVEDVKVDIVEVVALRKVDTVKVVAVVEVAVGRGGGCYGYPHDAKSKNRKLRLLYECAPMSFIVEQAGGKGSDGHPSVLDIQPTEIHQRVQFYIGSKEEVEKYLA
ncbi:hypothetical protein Bca52824_050580 [Brassica carinata]|uniref:D-fructose-1,6-bisphosphate 1-phosphohydrolase n=1 Tax=Brassica carinata TaxID=52824 RepID=A0A8X7UGX9_BRACI|nr:hypothetical protein Bca52824_050580 [Brassica carinata]